MREPNRPSAWVVGLLLSAGASVLPAGAQPVQGDVRSVGFRAAVPSEYVIRPGQWFPILVELTAQGTQAYDVELRCERVDLDGDRIAFVQPHVAVTPDVGIKRVWCYAVTLAESAGRPTDVDIIGDDGALISSVSVPGFESISNDTQLVLDISDKRVTGLNYVDSGQLGYSDWAWGQRRFYRPICVARLPARDLPDRWYGLEAVDVIVWDEPDPQGLPNNLQLPALIEWVRNGGQLVIGIGPAWSKIQKSALADIMPLTGNESAVEVRELGRFAARYQGPAAGGFKTPISVAVGQPTSDALVTFQDRLPDRRNLNLIALRCVGSGRVIATAARLRDLMGPGVSRDLYHELLDLNRNEPAFNEKEAEQGVFGRGPLYLYDQPIAQIEFQRAASARTLAAFAFVAAYVLLSTYGAWVWLKRHTLTHVSWAAFAAIAVAASLLSLGAVGLSRGVAGTVHNFSFVDLEAGSTQARATTYFGYKSNRRQRVDLSLPGDGNYLRPLATRDISEVAYATPERYAAVTAEATLLATPMRATLKQFEGFWRGELDGSVRGSLTADRRTGKVTPQSWLQNDLDIDFIGGYLLYIDPRLRERDAGVPYRAAGLNTCNCRPADRPYYGSEKVPPAVNVLALRVPPLKPGQKIDRLGASEDAGYNEYGIHDQQYARWQRASKPNPKEEPMLPTLRHRQVNDWVGIFDFARLTRPVEQFDAAALLASTRNLHLHSSDAKDFDDVGRLVSTAGLVDQDVTHWLARGQAILLLLANEPGPANLYLNGKPKDSKAGHSIYRVRIPIQYTGRPPRGSTP